LKAGDDKLSFNRPQWSFLSDPTNSDPSKHMQCRLQFELPADFKHPVFVYYKLTNFYQNHRRYVQSLSTDQLKGKAVSISTLSNCKPLASVGDKPIYPCGLIANSVFNGEWWLHELAWSLGPIKRTNDATMSTRDKLCTVPADHVVGERTPVPKAAAAEALLALAQLTMRPPSQLTHIHKAITKTVDTTRDADILRRYYLQSRQHRS
jgi:LEM3 (ligand-effect modulator 3) family / CDC50 family